MNKTKIKSKVGENLGKSKCCKGSISYEGGGYDGEDIVPVVTFCEKCGKTNPSVIQKVGRPIKLPF